MYAALGPQAESAASLTENLRSNLDADAVSRRSVKTPSLFSFPSSWCQLSPGHVWMALSSILISSDYSVRSGSMAPAESIWTERQGNSEKCQPVTKAAGSVQSPPGTRPRRGGCKVARLRSSVANPGHKAAVCARLQQKLWLLGNSPLS